MRFGVPMRRGLACAIVLAAAGLPLIGCVHADTAADRQFAEMRDQVGRIQAEQDRAGRLALDGDDGDLKVALAPTATKPAAPTTTSAAPHTIQIGGEPDDGQSDDPNDPTARPEIRLQGSAGASSRPLRGKTSRGKGEARIEAAQPDESTSADGSRPSVLDPEAKRSYDDALSLVQAKKYDRALEAFGAFLTKWPDHPYVENALYWRGEAYFARGEYLRAAEQFEAVLARGGNKAPDALLKIGRCHERLGSADRAKEYWDRLRRDYPRSDAAKKLQPASDDSRGHGAPKESR